MWLDEFAAPSLPCADRPALRKMARAALGGQDPRCFVAGLDITAADYAQSTVGLRIPSAAALASASQDRDDLLELLGVIFCAAKANVAGQARRFSQARRRAEPNGRTLLMVVSSILAHTERTEAYRAKLPWDAAPAFVPRDVLKGGTLQLDQVTRKPPGPFFCDRAIADLWLYLHCCENKISISLVQTERCQYPSVFRAVQSLTAAPPMISAVYGVDPGGVSLAPPFIGVHRPLRPPSTKESAAAWRQVWDALQDYAKGECRQDRVRAAIQAAAQAKEPSRGGSVASVVWLKWLYTHDYAWTSIAKADYTLLPGPVALFREKSQLP